MAIVPCDPSVQSLPSEPSFDSPYDPILKRPGDLSVRVDGLVGCMVFWCQVDTVGGLVRRMVLRCQVDTDGRFGRVSRVSGTSS